ncbi:hypothetical protein Tco_0401755 [Tanacetum coccineum]
MWLVTSPPFMPLKALSCNIFKNSSPIFSLEFVIIGELVCSPFQFFVSSKLAIVQSRNQQSPLSQEWRKMSVECQYAVLRSQNTTYCLEEQIRRLDCKTQYAVLGRRFDTSYPTGGYGVSVIFVDTAYGNIRDKPYWELVKRFSCEVLARIRRISFVGYDELSTHILHSPFFFGTSNVGTAHGLRDSRMSPFSNNPSTGSDLNISVVIHNGLLEELNRNEVDLVLYGTQEGVNWGNFSRKTHVSKTLVVIGTVDVCLGEVTTHGPTETTSSSPQSGDQPLPHAGGIEIDRLRGYWANWISMNGGLSWWMVDNEGLDLLFNFIPLFRNDLYGLDCDSAKPTSCLVLESVIEKNLPEYGVEEETSASS